MSEFQPLGAVLASDGWARLMARLEEPHPGDLCDLAETPKLEAEVARIQAVLADWKEQVATIRRAAQIESLTRDLGFAEQRLRLGRKRDAIREEGVLCPECFGEGGHGEMAWIDIPSIADSARFEWSAPSIDETGIGYTALTEQQIVYRKWPCSRPDCKAGQDRLRKIADGRAARERALQRRRLAQVWSRQMIPRKFLGHTLATWVDRVVEYGGEGWRLWAEDICAQLVGWSKSGKWLLLWSDVGTGKTSLLVGLLRILAEAGRVVAYHYIEDLFAKTKESFDGKSGLTLKQVHDSVTKVEVLALDDLGAEYTTPWTTAQVATIINDRYADGMMTLYATNLNPYGKDFELQLGKRAADRLRQSDLTFILHIDGPNLRDKKKNLDRRHP